jgi:hypothetical protein
MCLAKTMQLRATLGDKLPTGAISGEGSSKGVI